MTKKLKAESNLQIPLCTTNRINMPQTADGILGSGAAVSTTAPGILRMMRPDAQRGRTATSHTRCRQESRPGCPVLIVASLHTD